jgi:NADH dehydrogenase [ubiquinone] 1 alpha subcomplex assembly factor 7
MEMIKKEIASDGPLTVARYMELALGDAEHGYYATRDPLGRHGDFITAPEVSQMFGELIGLWAATVWEGLGRPAPIILAELGPGRGTLIADALRATDVMPDFNAAVHLHLIDTSPVLRRCQAATLAGHAPVWHESFDSLPDGPVIVIANEFFDALPIRQFAHRKGAWAERRVTSADGGLAFTETPLTDTEMPTGAPREAPLGAVWEASPAGRTTAAALGARIEGQGGAALIFDYGHGGGLGDSFQAVRAHKYADPLDQPGETDLTAHVDFGALAQAACAAGAVAFGPVAQGRLLLTLGLAERAAMLTTDAEPEIQARIQSEVRRLVAPTEMGAIFQALALAAPGAPVPPGFEDAQAMAC